LSGQLGILGGTFDPIHIGHLLTAEIARETLALDTVLFVPAADPPHKLAMEKTPAHHRQAMVALAIAANPRFGLSTVDLARPGPHYSIDTVRLIRAEYGLSAEECYFIIGGDSLVDLPKWHQPTELIKLCRLAAVHRPGYQPDVTALESMIPGLTARLDWVEIPLIGIAASDIRQRVQQRQTIRYQVVEPVRIYIEEHGLYYPEKFFPRP